MNDSQLISLRDAIDAHMRGGPVQWKQRGEWIDIVDPNFFAGGEWRKKPRGQAPIVGFAVVGGKFDLIPRQLMSRELAIQLAKQDGADVVQLIETSREKF